MPKGIRRYGLGKFKLAIDEYVYRLSLDGVETIGDVSEIGIAYYRLELGPDALKDIEEEIRREKGDPLTEEEKDLIRNSYGAILAEDDRGFVYVYYAGTKREYDAKWAEIEEEVNALCQLPRTEVRGL